MITSLGLRDVAARWTILEQNQEMRPRTARREAHRAAQAAEREASVYVRTVLESVRDVSYLATNDAREPWERRSSGSAERLRLRWLMTPPTDQRSAKRAARLRQIRRPRTLPRRVPTVRPAFRLGDFTLSHQRLRRLQ